MHWTITLIFILLWLVGLIGTHVLGAWMYFFLLIGVILVVINLLSRDRTF
jgi:hypothetical protein